MMKPKILIADEPTTALDATLEVEIIALLRELQKEIGCAMIFVTHHLGVVTSLCDDVVVLHNGIVQEAGEVREIFVTLKAITLRTFYFAIQPTLRRSADASQQ